MSKQMTVAIAGLGSRGRDTYAKAAKIYPDSDHVLITAETSGKWYDRWSGKTINNSNIFNVIKVNRRMQLWKLNRSEWVL